MNKKLVLVLITLIISCKKDVGNYQYIYLTNKSNEEIYYFLSKDDTIRDITLIERIRPDTFDIVSGKRPSIIYEYKEDSIISRENQMFPFRVKRQSTKEIFKSRSLDGIMNAISMKQQINIDYNGKLNVFIVKAKDLNSFSDRNIVKNKLYRKIRTVTENDITSDTLIIDYK
jgi:hypothetical protein